ncbi:hypothetical protein AUP40_09860 [Thalassospira xiamenensis]|uniref:Uncharacterized protein n=1 Tax=Thalassospira xiamenensis TaxID=220697 RepID=A0ABR5Y5R9_9PROT|nr:hypothetical protein AUP40_09860 [Thalassospira xiamenensis]MAB32367.1 hypothetical protein [Thalassospira sp.]OHY99718.1 hypothetical protein BC440_17775 [Thalassospira sp. MIT1004]HBS24351.1 hypothetical protein [Thalassospira sp.]
MAGCRRGRKVIEVGRKPDDGPSARLREALGPWARGMSGLRGQAIAERDWLSAGRLLAKLAKARDVSGVARSPALPEVAVAQAVSLMAVCGTQGLFGLAQLRDVRFVKKAPVRFSRSPLFSSALRNGIERYLSGAASTRA